MKIEVQHGTPFRIVRQSPLIGPTTDMECIEYWEDRLLKLDIPFVITYQEKMGNIFYYVFVKGGKL